MKPMDIEKESFAIIEKELTTDIPAEYKPVVKRVIHTTADFSYETSMTFSKGRCGYCYRYQYGEVRNKPQNGREVFLFA